MLADEGAQCYMILYTGPQSADKELQDASRSTGKPSLSQKYNITGTSIDTICYVLTLVRIGCYPTICCSHRRSSYRLVSFLTLKLAGP